MVEIRRSLIGRKLGLGPSDELILNKSDAAGREMHQTILGGSVVTTISSAQLLALNATPRSVVAAPGAGLAIIPHRVLVYKPAGTAYAGIAAGEDLVLKYTDGSGAQCSSVIETTGFLDQATAQTRIAGMPGSTGTTAGDYAPVANAAVVLHLLSGEIITGNSPLYVRVFYDIVKTVFTS